MPKLSGIGKVLSGAFRSLGDLDWGAIARRAAIGAGVGGIVNATREKIQGGSFSGGAVRGAMYGGLIGGAVGIGKELKAIGADKLKEIADAAVDAPAILSSGKTKFSQVFHKDIWESFGEVGRSKVLSRAIAGAAIGGGIGGIRSAAEGQGFGSGFVGGAVIGGVIGGASGYAGAYADLIDPTRPQGFQGALKTVSKQLVALKRINAI